LLICVLFVFFNRTLTGKALRATAVSKAGAQLVGISPSAAGELALSLAAFIGAISGILIGPLTTIYFDSGFILSLKGFVGAILGGLAGYALAAAGALSVGLLESFASYWASAYKEIIVFTMIVPVLMWRSLTDPHGHREEQ
jgi:branched-chain amino acid transport system permease protein